MMEKSIIEYPKFIILYNGEPGGCVSCKKVEMGIYEVGCLCVVPEFPVIWLTDAFLSLEKIAV